MKIKSIFFNITFKGILFLCVGFFLIGILLYRSIELISNSKRVEKEKIYIINKNNWCKEQTKYLYHKIFYPIRIASIKNEYKSDTIIYRDGYVNINPKAKANILICHGFTTNKEDMFILRFLLKDYNIISFDFRAHGENISYQSCTLGCDEKYDVIAAANYVKKDPRLSHLPLFVYGFSMGAVASILAQSEHKNLFVGAIWDCPFQSTNELTNIALQYFKININGYNINLPLRNIIKKYIYNKNAQQYIQFFLRLFSSMDSTGIQTCIKNISPIEALEKVTIPFLLIGCHNDDKAPAESICKMYQAHKKNTFSRCWISAGRGHFDALFINPEKYIHKINKFIDSILSRKYQKKKLKKIIIDENTFLINKKR